jgi:hypothetical protein
MNEHPKPIWYESLKETPWNQPEPSREQVMELTKRANQTHAKAAGKKRRLNTIGLSSASLLIVVALWANGALDTLLIRVEQAIESSDPAWSVRSAAWRDGNKLFEAFPGGDFTSGQANGCWWNLYVPFEQVEGSKLRIEGTHKDSGLQLDEVPEMGLSSPMLAYANFTRVSSRFDLPIGGLWKFTMYLDDAPLGDVVFNVPEGAWKPDSTFQFDTYSLKGEEHRLGFLDVGLRAGLPDNKFMWFFWGRTDEETRSLFGKKLLITGTRQSSPSSIPLFEGSIGTPNPMVNPPIPNNDKVAKSPVAMSLPSAGMWRLDAIIDGKWFGSIFVDVH